MGFLQPTYRVGVIETFRVSAPFSSIDIIKGLALCVAAAREGQIRNERLENHW